MAGTVRESDGSSRNVHPARAPALPVAIALALGILGGHVSGVPWIGCILFAAVSLILWIAATWLGRYRVATICVLLAVVAVGAARHRMFLSMRDSTDISRYVRDEPRLVRLVGVAIERPGTRPALTDPLASAWPQPDRTSCRVQCTAIKHRDETIPVTGRVQLFVAGRMDHIQAGEQIEVYGWIARPRPPGNPGEFDYRDYLHRQGIHCILRAEHSDAIRRLDSPSAYPSKRIVRALRDKIERLCAEHLNERTRPVAIALLLGNRRELPEETRESFAETGMMHILAISGLHVGILAGFVFVGCRLCRIRPNWTCLLIVAAIIGYAIIAETRPPIVRATVFITAACAGWPWYRQASLTQALAIAALVVLAINPTDLFDPGAQLSFAAVVGIIAAGRWLKMKRHEPSPPVARPWWWKRMHRFALWMARGWLVLFAIWMMTAPLVATHFHLISPIGLLLNVILMPLIVVTLWLGYLFVIFGSCIPFCADLLGGLFELTLGWLLGIGEFAARWKMGHRYISSPPIWWVIGYYLWMLAILAWREPKWNRNWRLAAILAWVALGLMWGLRPHEPNRLDCTTLDVGHGVAILTETPNGRTLLYDAGSLSNNRRAERAVQNALFASGHSRIDVLVLSHADFDHFNAAIRLMESIPIGRICVPRPFLDLEQTGVELVLNAATKYDIPITIIGQGDRIKIDPRVVVKVLHPKRSAPVGDDNAASAILQIEYADRRILLTGDVENRGLDSLLSQPPRHIDLLLAPHHGSQRANPPELADWSQPDHVVISTADKRAAERLKSVYSDAKAIYSTRHDGAVIATIEPDGAMKVAPYRASE